MDYLLRAIGLGESSVNFPFRVDPDSRRFEVSFVDGIPWTLQWGTRIGDACEGTGETTQVSIFHLSLKGLSERQQLAARNAFKRALTLRILGLLRCVGAAEQRDHLYIATDSCVPLEWYLDYQSEKLRQGDGRRHPSQVEPKRRGAEQQLTIAMDYLLPISADLLALGLHQLASGLKAMHLHQLVHGNVAPRCVFVNVRTGEWFLFGMELVSLVSETLEVSGSPSSTAPIMPSFPVVGEGLLKFPLRPPELSSDQSGAKGLWYTFIQNPSKAWAFDVWGFGLIIAAYCRALTPRGAAAASYEGPLDHAKLVSITNAVPPSLRSFYSALISDTAAKRPRVQSLLDDCPFVTENAYVNCVNECRMYVMLDEGSKENFCSMLRRQLQQYPTEEGRKGGGALVAPSSSFPLGGVCWMLGCVMDQLKIFIPQDIVCSVVLLSQILLPLEHQSRSEEEATAATEAESAGSGASEERVSLYDEIIGPLIESLFLCSDNYTRLQLLRAVPLYAPGLDPQRWVGKNSGRSLWLYVAECLRSPSAELVIAAAKSAVLVASQLPASLVNSQVVELIGAVQNKPDALLRANGLVSLQALFPLLPVTKRMLIVQSAVVKGLSDASLPVRLAAVRALSSALQWGSTIQCGTTLLPHLMVATVDHSSAVREIALQAVEIGIRQVREHHARQLQGEGGAGSDAVEERRAAEMLWTFDIDAMKKEALHALFDTTNHMEREASKDSFSPSNAATPPAHRHPTFADSSAAPRGVASRSPVSPKVVPFHPPPVRMAMQETLADDTEGWESDKWSDDDDSDDEATTQHPVAHHGSSLAMGNTPKLSHYPALSQTHPLRKEVVGGDESESRRIVTEHRDVSEDEPLALGSPLRAELRPKPAKKRTLGAKKCP